ncbi:MAG: AraC family transcriptional regulator [Phycisphaerae bacterium]|nr:AraC family transcriptional regulator [Phycisphaerae bacterium]
MLNAESSFSQINYFIKTLKELRETISITDFFALPHIAHVNRLLANDVCLIHEQRFFEISLLLAGEMIYKIGDKEILLHPGGIVIIPPKIKHYWRILEKDSDVFSFMINISKYGERSRCDLTLLNDSIKKHNYHINSFSKFEQIIRQIIDEAIEQQTACEEKVLYLIRIAIAELIRVLLPKTPKNIFPRNFPPARGENKRDIAEIINYYIQDNMNRPISLLEISNHVGLSLGHLNFLFNSETKMTINQAIINRRLECACRYLKQTDRHIKDIATLVGYKDVNYLYIQFKKKYGLTPSQYRRSNA